MTFGSIPNWMGHPAASDLKPHDLRAYIYAAGAEWIFKVYPENSDAYRRATEIVADTAVRCVRETEAFRISKRLEPCSDLDAGSLALLETALPYNSVGRMEMALCKAVMLPEQGQLDVLQLEYRKRTGGALWDNNCLDFQALLHSLEKIKLDSAYPLMRKAFLQQQTRTMPPTGAQHCVKDERRQRFVFAQYFADLRASKSFQRACDLVAGDTTDILKIMKTLKVRTKFHRMLVAREFAALIPGFPRDAAHRVACVGGGAAPIIRQMARSGRPNTDAGLLEDMKDVHAALHLDMRYVELFCPRGWGLSDTEGACCELRKFRAALAAVFLGKCPHRIRDAEGVEERHAVTLRRLSIAWPHLGFTANPAEAQQSAPSSTQPVLATLAA